MKMKTIITASILYNFVQCPHRVTMDLFEDPARKDPTNPFVQLLWEKGNAFEQEVIEGLRIPFTDLSSFFGDEKERLTMEAMKRGDDIIYSGRIRADDLVGEPDILRRQGNGYVAGDIKSGAGVEGGNEDTDGKPKKHYAVQLALYTDILERLGFSGGRNPFIWDIHGEEVDYDLDSPQGARKRTSLWDEYRSVLETVRHLVLQTEDTLPAYATSCKLCHWYTACLKRMEDLDDLTLIPELGRASRDAMLAYMRRIRELAEADLETLINGRKTLIPRVGPDRLKLFQERAILQKKPGARPYLKEQVILPSSDFELFFDVETDPMRDICYLHGFIERRGGDRSTERYIAFIAEKPTLEEEERAFAEAVSYVENSRPSAIYYFSAYERTIWRKLQRKYPQVASVDDIEAVFDPALAVDLYLHVVRSKTIWPTRDNSIKTLASYLGFMWRDSNPSGAASIEWYHRWVESGDASIRQRILDYNEDDCRAMRVLLDGIRKLCVS
jgi:predicted RecB family nuclease